MELLQSLFAVDMSLKQQAEVRSASPLGLGGSQLWDWLDSGSGGEFWGGVVVVCVWLTLYHCVGGLHGRQVGNNSDVIITVGVLNVDGDGFLHFPVQTGHHPRWACHIGQAALMVIAGGQTHRLQHSSWG